ncbi:MAG: hypothetical protein LBH18_01545 [Spirochaetaceae bacterium]|jgi:hypothetical protein|nr:hypothetical protein [Spirochaetaceae bacterium]
MKKLCMAFIVMTLFIKVFSNVYAADYIDGRIKLAIDEKTGRFSLFYMTDVGRKIYEPLFWEKDKRTSFLSAYINGKEYKMGSNSEFKMVIRGEKNKPALVFESRFLSVTESFSFIRTASSGVSNGVRIDIMVESWSPDTTNIGLRLLVDTFLGEKNKPPFRTDLRTISSETIIDKTSPEEYWVTRNNDYGLMGSIFVEGTETPDFLQFANWKRMNAARYKVNYVSGRSFNYTPFSVKDSAVCYFLDIKPMKRWEQRMMTVLLAAEDDYGFGGGKFEVNEKEYPQSIVVDEKEYVSPIFVEEVVPPPQISIMNASNSSIVPMNVTPPAVESKTPAAAATPTPTPERGKPRALFSAGAVRVDIMTLRELVNKVDEYIYTGTTPTEEELKGMELTIARLKARYGSIFRSF